ncbi:MAG: Tyrosine-specific transport protein [Chlamydiia bacterium]|nr:Tyrosine-specific transport protein [Chlamydiia bacterium]MCH9615348.1 Tyrosine-specific transport protein [Chlamydiia bacterium]MCH9628330.1 Tyrosine-specific transport protein [Chlamydiia bacterium]
MKFYTCKTIGATLLVTGTTIGAGMLALPVTTGSAGFFPAACLFIVSFIYMLMSLFLLLEVNLWSHKISANMITLAKEHLGWIGQIIAWFAFLLLLYAVAAAYISAGGALISSVLNEAFLEKVSVQYGMWVFVIVFGCFTVFGTRGVDAVNRLFVFGLLFAFLFLIVFTTPHVEWQHFETGNPSALWAAVPITILSFTSHIILPSLRTYLSGDLKKLKKALIWGSVIPLIIYLVWVFLIMGILPPEGEFSLAKIGMRAHPVSGITKALNTLIQVPYLGIIVGFFSFFALVTSFFGVALSLFDFLADGLRLKKQFWNRILLMCLMFIPPLAFALYYPKGFVLALGYAGVFVAILYGILPAIMVLKGRYIEKLEFKYRVPGGWVIPAIVFLGALFVIYLQIAATRGFF